ncbi:hypothetical protein ASPZODRAFT_76868 [Penicilliopsis zonata CBS 506.65]|uniref:Protein kinase domain-containing protein n=1 Tax=Penicilliopsis zonata CBS 506.65 TaxID=1073090 RepID=A0A1L9S5J4_9EURO|nr:hypothetical protein ASPZODRAFT_76868 [Penicilliopsis zonata CBS 506.65]OJJ42430.1 hypothetical protein ASPZODRAFT_76868 [Penicilliopsis zonata CBS 506.65]
MASSLFIDLDHQPIRENDTLGYGRSGVVILRDGLAVKIPLRHPWSTDIDFEINMGVIHREQEIYRRLQSSQIIGVVPCVHLLDNETHLVWMKNGDIRAYLKKNAVSRRLQLAWFRQMTQTISQIHDSRVLIADISCRNFLLDLNLAIKLCDFSESSLLPLETDMESADDNGFSIFTDIGQLGAVMYEVITGQQCEFNLFRDNAADDGRATWPRRDSLPNTHEIWLVFKHIEKVAKSIFRKLPSRIRVQENRVERHSRRVSPIILSPELQPFLNLSQHSPQNFQKSLSALASDEEYVELHGYELIARSFLWTDEMKEGTIQKIHCRLSYTIFFLMTMCIQEAGQSQDAIASLSQIINGILKLHHARVQKKLRSWVEWGERLWLLSQELGGPGVLVLLPNDIGESMYVLSLKLLLW